MTSTFLTKANFRHVESPITDPTTEMGKLFLENPRNFIGRQLMYYRMKGGFPVAKYISVNKFFETEKAYILRGMSRKIYKYTVGILTTENKFYFNTIKINQNALTRKSVPLLHSVFLRGYNYNKATRISFSENMRPVKGPVEVLFSIIDLAFGLAINKRTFINKCKVIDRKMCLCTVKKGEKFGRKHVKRVVEILHKRGMFSFCHKYPFIIEAIEDFLSGRKILSNVLKYVDIPVGIIYLYILDTYSERSKKVRDIMGNEESDEKKEIERTLLEKLNSGEPI